MRKFLSFVLIVISLDAYAFDSSQIYRQDIYLTLSKFQHKNLVIDSQLKDKWSGYLAEFKDFAIKDAFPTKESIIFTENGTGRLLTLDSTGTFNRIDQTKYAGDRFGSYEILYNDTLFSIGGYGFWRTTGAIRFFNSKTREWSVIKTKVNLPLAQGVNTIFHYSANEHKLYVIYTSIIDDYIKGKRSNDSVFVNYFDFKTKDWSQKTFVFNPNIAKTYSSLRKELSTGPSLLLKSNIHDDFLDLNFKNNELYYVDENNLFQLHNIIAQVPEYIISYNDTAYCVYNANGEQLFTLNYLQNKEIKENWIYKEQSVISNSLLNISLWLLLAASGLLAFFYFKKRLPKQKNTNQQTEDTVFEKNSSVRFLMILDEQEQRLLFSIIQNHKAASLTSSDQINEILGINNRIYKIRNNIRAATLKLINKKFIDYIGTNEDLIIRVRSKFDKRYFAYTINEKYITKIELERTKKKDK